MRFPALRALTIAGAAAIACVASPAFASNSSIAPEASAPDAETLASLFKWMPKNGDKIAFDVKRNNSDFGSHTIRFEGDPNETLTVKTDVSLKAGLGPITVFRYTLSAKETWENGVLVGLEGKTNDDGDKLSVSASRSDDSLSVEGTKFTGSVPLGIVPSSHWNMDQLFNGQMISTEDGEILPVTTETIGEDTLTIGGETINATHYRLQSEIALDLWYDDQSRLVKLAFSARGQDIIYRLKALY